MCLGVLDSQTRGCTESQDRRRSGSEEKGAKGKAFMLVARCKMQIDIHREQKTVCIWLSRKESSEYKNEKSPILTPLFEGYRKRAYHIAVFMSGSGDLYDSMLGLLLYNRRKMAEKELGVQWPRSRG